MTTAAVIVAAGRGRRLGGAPKQYRPLAGETVLTRTLRGALGSEAVDLVLVAIHSDDRAGYDAAVAPLADPRLLPPVAGGAERADTVRLALDALAPHAPAAVLVHDAARPFAPRGMAGHAARGEGPGRVVDQHRGGRVRR
ncbi:MAG TPA: 2-C-methyl-D-erythritol 4-phosphate cytidylyltransferase, partial [Thermohalobaculum sp.]|nr:2-C-methyl-D-erythritol 4-phosphate cytidylyltransferase [Thermohalobaculum sp.]